MRKPDRVLDDVDLFFDSRVDVYCRVGDEEQPWIARRVDHEDMANASSRTELFLVNDRTHEFVGMEAALHQRLNPVVASEFNRLSSRSVAVLRWHEFISGDFYFGLIRCGSDLGGGSDQHGNDEICFGSLDCTKQGIRINRMNHGGPDRLQGHRAPDEVLVMVVALAKIKRGFNHPRASHWHVRTNLRISHGQ